jgi:hypothetical protein
LVVENRCAHLERLLGGVMVPDLTQDRIIQYMGVRKEEGANGRTINIELSVLSRAMVSTWSVLWPKAKKLDENHDVGRALESTEENAVIEAAAKRPIAADLPVPSITCVDRDAQR